MFASERTLNSLKNECFQHSFEGHPVSRRVTHPANHRSQMPLVDLQRLYILDQLLLLLWCQIRPKVMTGVGIPF